MEKPLLHLNKTQVKESAESIFKSRRIIAISSLQSKSVSAIGFNKPISKTIIFLAHGSK